MWIVDHAVVVGAGIGGLTASLVLSRVAARVTLVERAERPSEVGAALALQPNGMAVLDRLGLLSAVEAVSARIDRMDIRSVTGRRLLTAGMPDLGGGLDHAIAVRRTDLHRLLLEAVAGVASVDTRFGWAAVSADPSGAVRITSTAENGPDFGSISLRADVVVGADGANSAVRGTGGFVSRVSSGSSYVRTIVRGRAHPWFEEYWTPLGSFGQAPLGGDLVYFWAAAHVAGAAEAVSRRDLAAFRQVWRRVVPSPQPMQIFELRPVRWLLEQGAVVIAAGGGGIPTMYLPGTRTLVGVEAVVDKDLASSLMAQLIDADEFVVATDADAVYVGWETAQQRALSRVTPDQLATMDFPDGSMGPKVNAACDFVLTTKRPARIGGLSSLPAVLGGEAGTVVVHGQGVAEFY